MKQLFFDLDGVLCDFVGGAMAVHGMTIPYEEITWNFYEQVGMTAEDFWKPLKDYYFWRELKPCPDGIAVFQMLASSVPKEEIGFLTSGLCVFSIDAKRAWLDQHLPGYSGGMVTTNEKWRVGAKNKLLIDDNTEQVEKFESKGNGTAFLFPRPWNRTNNNLGIPLLEWVNHILWVYNELPDVC